MLALTCASLSFHTRAPRTGRARPASSSLRMSLGENALDSLLDQGKASDAIELLQRSSSGLELTNARVTKLLDAACAASADGMAGAADGAALMEQQANSQQAAMDFQIKQQNDLLACYKLLADKGCLLYTSPSPRDRQKSRMPSSA